MGKKVYCIIIGLLIYSAFMLGRITMNGVTYIYTDSAYELGLDNQIRLCINAINTAGTRVDNKSLSVVLSTEYSSFTYFVYCLEAFKVPVVYLDVYNGLCTQARFWYVVLVYDEIGKPQLFKYYSYHL